MPEIDALSVKITSSAKSASNGINSLVSTLEKLKKATAGATGLENTTKGLSELSLALKILDSSTASRLKELAEGMSALKAVSGIKLSPSLPKAIGEIITAAKGLTIEDTVNLKMLAPAIASLSAANDVKISSTIGSSLSTIVTAMKGIEPAGINNLRNFANAAGALSSLNGIKISSSIGNQLASIGAAVELLNSTPLNLDIVQNIADAVAPLANVGKANMTPAINQLKKIPEVARELEKVDVARFKQTVQEIANAMAPLAQELDKIGRAFSNFPNQLNRVATLTNNLTGVNTKAKRSFTEFLSAAKTLIGSLKAVGNVIIGLIKNVNTYIEDVNLFQASMGEYADAAGRYADKVAEVMGIDPATWMRNQGVFMTLATGFGVAGDRAYIMSQQLTQLGYDLSSFFNLDVDDAMQKLQSGLSGELEPLRRLGYDLSQARLQAIAFSLGIDKAYSSMTQAEKSQLRYYAIMTQVTTAQGDMARTLEAPANQIRIFSAQVTQAARALGSALIPMLNKILPYAIAAAKAIRILAASIASLFGFELPEVDYSGIAGTTGAVDDLTNSLDGAGGSAKKLKSYLMGFDELNVIDPNSGSGGGGGGGIGGITGDDFDFDLPHYDFLGDAITTQVDKIMAKWKPAIEWVQAHLDEILTIGGAIGAAFSMWKIASSLNPALGTLIGDLSRVSALVGSLATAVITIALSYHFTNAYLDDDGKWEDLVAGGITTALGTSITAAGVSKAFGRTAGKFTAGALLLLDAAIGIGQMGADVAESGYSEKDFCVSLKSVIEAGLGGALLAGAAGLSVGAGAIVGAVLAISAAAVVTVVAINANREALRQKAMWGGLELTKKEMERVAERMLGVDVDGSIRIIGAAIERRDAAKAAVNQTIREFNVELNKLVLGITVDNDKETVANLKDMLTGENGIIPLLQSTLDESYNVLSIGAAIMPKYDEEGNVDMGFLEAYQAGSGAFITAATQLGNELSRLIEKGMEEQLTDDEARMQSVLTNWLNGLSSSMAESEVRANIVVQVSQSLVGVTQDTFSGILSEAATGIDEARAMYEQIQTDRLVEYSVLMSMMKETMTVYETEGRTGEQAYIDLAATYAQMEAEYYDLLNGDYVDQMIKTVTAPVADKFRIAFAEMLGDEMVFGGNAETLTYDFLYGFSNLYAVGIDTADVEAYALETRRLLYSKIEEAIGSDNFQILMEMEQVLGVSGWDVLSDDVKQQMYNAIVGGFQQMGLDETYAISVFQALGYDITDLIYTGIETGTTAMSPETQQAIEDGLIPDPNDISEEMVETFGDATKTATETVDIMATGAGTRYMERMSNSITEGGADAVAAAEGVTKAIAKALFGAVEGTDTKGGSGSAYKGITNEWSGIAGWFEAAVTDPIAASFGNMRSDMESTFRNVKSMFQSQWSGISGWFASNVARPMVNSLKNAGWYDAGREATQGIKRRLDSVELPKFHLDWNTVTKKVEETTINLPILDLKFYARGGFPTAGQMFVARESGPELVGRIGNRSAVANNDQIVAGIEEGVYRAVTAAVSDSDNNINVTVYLDGKQLYRNQQQVARATGYSFAK